MPCPPFLDLMSPPCILFWCLHRFWPSFLVVFFGFGMFCVGMIGDKEYDERDHIGEKKEEILDTDIEMLKLRKLSSKRYIDNVET